MLEKEHALTRRKTVTILISAQSIAAIISPKSVPPNPRSVKTKTAAQTIIVTRKPANVSPLP